ncbi:MAG TPA: saccharopine dehydrogenase NADP-binding domain-containing protein [Myxococcota bacterium]|nr:saccharopine dehydrogenase NADP-binding domain-containing protein [Myxococcota bacterium]
MLWGATGYTGRLVAERLAADPTLRWALAGRDAAKLERVRDALAAAAPHARALPVLVGDAGDPASLAAIAARTRVVCTTVGPYALYGSHLVAACAAAGTHYCDLTGELPWIRRMIDAHHDAAAAAGARIVHCCGFDSIPSDLGVWMLHDAARGRGRRLARVDALFGESSGGFSGGTFASMMNVFDEARRDPSVGRLLDDPYALDPTPRSGGPDGPDAGGVAWEPRVGRWTAPFVMAAINTRVVRRSNAVAGYPYGRDFRYVERMTLPAGPTGLPAALAVAGGTAAVSVVLRVPALRNAARRWMPKPGEGPTPEQRARGFFVARLLATCDDGSTLRGRVEDRRDPGYGSTAVMLAESARCLARDPLTTPFGVLTPASAMGGALLARLRAAGMTWEIEGGPA